MKKIPNYLIVIIIISSLLNIASYLSLKDRIFSIYKNKIQKANVIDLGTGQEETINDIFWANEIKKGGYFLFFRHAHRDKWDESVNYLDNYALTNKIDEKKSTFHEGTCLSVPRGVEGARIMGEFFRYFNIKIYKVISSPSCRAKETAKLVVGRIDEISNCLLHPTSWNIQQVPKCAEFYRDKLLRVNFPSDQNIFLSAHGNIIPNFGKSFYDKNEYTKITGKDLRLEEGGFIVVQKVNNQLIVQYKFNKFKTFANSLSRFEIN